MTLSDRSLLDHSIYDILFSMVQQETRSTCMLVDTEIGKVVVIVARGSLVARATQCGVALLERDRREQQEQRDN